MRTPPEPWIAQAARPVIAIGVASLGGLYVLAAAVDGFTGWHVSEPMGVALRNMPPEVWSTTITLSGGYAALRSFDKFVATMRKR